MSDNRIIEVQTSADGVDWHRDARYFYSCPERRRRDPHGPLARVELGEHLVQGLGHAYTLQGWLKGINSDRLDPASAPQPPLPTERPARCSQDVGQRYSQPRVPLSWRETSQW
jgi:hypothetical protein